jgi:hypothetical protein
MMRKFAAKNFEAIASILIVAAFAGVAMFLNLGNQAWFAGRLLNGANQAVPEREAPPIYAENVWRGKHTWKPVDFGAGGLSLAEFTQQMWEKNFGEAEIRKQKAEVPDGAWQSPITNRKSQIAQGPGQSPITNRKSQMAEGSPDLPHLVHVVARHADGTVFLDEWGHNLRVNSGINWQYNQMAGTTAAACTYIALSNSVITPAPTDTALSGEITGNGLTRTLGTATHTSNATSYTLPVIFTASGTQAAQAAAVFNASSSGTMCFENTFTQASLVSGDTLTVTWTISF